MSKFYTLAEMGAYQKEKIRAINDEIDALERESVALSLFSIQYGSSEATKAQFSEICVKVAALQKKKNSITHTSGPTTAENLEERFDNGEDVMDYFTVPIQRINLDLPVWAIKEIDQEATRRGVARQALIRMWLTDRLDVLKDKPKTRT